MNNAAALLIVNRVLAQCGGNLIATFQDGTQEAQLAELNYEPLVRGLLDNQAFRWAQRYFTLSYIAGTSPNRFKYVYQKPADCISIRSLMLPNGGGLAQSREIPYDTYGDKITCDYGVETGVQLFYCWRVEEPEWPPSFEMAVASMLEQAFLKGFEKFSEATVARDEAAAMVRQSRYNASTQHSGRVAFRSRLVAARRATDWTSGSGR